MATPTGSNLRSVCSRVLHIVFPSWRRSLIAAEVGVTCFVLRVPLAAHMLVSLLTHIVLAIAPRRRR
jgi:hypothetical protein